jgi:hypothetical protein
LREPHAADGAVRAAACRAVAHGKASTVAQGSESTRRPIRSEHTVIGFDNTRQAIMRTTPILILMLATLATPALADCVAQTGAPRPRLVELYTSEGCSSCPPADAWLRGIPAGTNLAPLEFHVDYWDSLGWRDRFADPRYTQRQQQQAARDGGSGVYTPQVVLDGRSWSGWYRGTASAATATGGASMRAEVTAGTPLRVHLATTFDASADAAAYRNYVAVTENGLSSDVRAGENSGVLLRHDHVVRAFAGPLALDAETSLALPADLDRSRARLVAFAQRGDGAVAQVLECAL